MDNMRRFLMYCAYAFGTPITLAIIAILLNSFDLLPANYKTGIGEETCLIVSSDESNAEFVYIYLPLIVTISVNIVFYSITAYKIYCAQKESAFKGVDSKRHAKNDAERLR